MLFSITALELATGFSSDLLRKWRRRYGFPKPVTQSPLCFDEIQLDQLRLIKRLLDHGYRPSQVVGKSSRELRLILDASTLCAASASDNLISEAMSALKRYDTLRIRALLVEARQDRSLYSFIDEIIFPLMQFVGTGWARQDLEIHHEHICTVVINAFLLNELASLEITAGATRIVLATPPMEQHALGLLMAECVLSESGAQCINMGIHLPPNEMAMAAIGCKAEILGVSFSFSYPRSAVRPWLAQLRKLLPQNIELWAGGAGTSAIRRSIPGVRIFTNLHSAKAALLARQNRPLPLDE